jgi:hypothetical protein
MIYQASGWIFFIIYLLIASILLWLCLYLASSWIISKSYAKDKKMVLFFAAILLVLLVPIISGVIGMVLNFLGNALASLRTLIYPRGQNVVGSLTPVIAFLLFLIILKFVCSMESWEKTLWISLIGLFLLFILYSLFPELMLFGSAF